MEISIGDKTWEALVIP